METPPQHRTTALLRALLRCVAILLYFWRVTLMLAGVAVALVGIWAIHPPSAMIALGVVLIIGALIG